MNKDLHIELPEYELTLYCDTCNCVVPDDTGICPICGKNDNLVC